MIPAVAPHALYTNSDETLKAARALANRYNAPLLIHLSETKKENDDELAQAPHDAHKTLDSLGVLQGPHGGRALRVGERRGHGDSEGAQRRRGALPSSNMKLASGVAPVVRMLALGIHVGLGPDGPAGSNNDFNMFEEMDLAAKLAKGDHARPAPCCPLRRRSRWRRSAARAYWVWSSEIGSLETGKRADMITIRLDRPNAVPLYDAISQMVYALKAEDVRDVMVKGKPVVRDGKIATLDEPAILAKAAEYGLRVSASLGK